MASSFRAVVIGDNSNPAVCILSRCTELIRSMPVNCTQIVRKLYLSGTGEVGSKRLRYMLECNSPMR